MTKEIEGLRRTTAAIASLAETDPRAAEAVREAVRPDLQYHSDTLRYHANTACMYAAGKHPEEAAEALCAAAEALPEVLGLLQRKFERAAGLRRPRRKALWTSVDPAK